MGPTYFYLHPSAHGQLPLRAELVQTSNGKGECSNSKPNATHGGSTKSTVQQPIGTPNFGTIPQPPSSAKKIAPSANRLSQY